MPRPANVSIDLGNGYDDREDYLEDQMGYDEIESEGEELDLLERQRDGVAKKKSSDGSPDGPDSGKKDGKEKEGEKKKRVKRERLPGEEPIYPRAKLNAARLCGPTGLNELVKEFVDVRWKGKGHEDDDLMLLMSKLEGWTHRLYPRFNFDDVLEKVEGLGAKKEVRTTVKKLLLNMPTQPEDFIGEGIRESDYSTLPVASAAVPNPLPANFFIPAPKTSTASASASGNQQRIAPPARPSGPSDGWDDDDFFESFMPTPAELDKLTEPTSERSGVAEDTATVLGDRSASGRVSHQDADIDMLDSVDDAMDLINDLIND
ncbi:putative TIMELESS-interacting protein [Hypsibius exemplaris]|uniref:TIMELESS-interacting protein n=1 Tax=Hypsibius exemplaris TaxID=2072580 RepID=A0A1W0X1C4_HYPEX|nr:putative TIMELESS-interacting protein [Hypsibius exemplaris]